MAAAAALPQFLVLNPSGYIGNAAWYKKEGGGAGGLVWVAGGSNSVFDPLAKIEVERAKINGNYVHLRFCYSNRYWRRAAEGEDPDKMVAESKQPIEEASDPLCTLFEPFLVSGSTDVFYFRHVQTGRLVRHETNVWVEVTADATLNETDHYFTAIDYETLIQLPEHVAFKGENGKYLQSIFDDKTLIFAATDPYEIPSGYEVHQMLDGHVRIRSDYLRRYWRMDGDWILGDSSDTTANDSSTLFWPVKVDATTIGLRCKNTGKFCNRYNFGDHKDNLASASDTITAVSKLQVEELVLDRQIYYVNYRMEDARIFDEQPYLAGTALVVNATDNQTSESVTITYQDEKSYTFSRGMSITAGVSTTIKTSIPFIVEGQISFSLEVSGNFQWDTTTTTTTSVAATGTVDVPPRSSVIIEYVGTKGTCNIPYSYAQLVKSATDGKIKRDQKTDGTYTGVSCYNFFFKMSEPQSII